MRGALLAMLVGSLVACSGAAEIGEEPAGGSRVGTREGREALFDQILDMTEDREAFSPLKEEAMGYSPLDDMRAVRSEVVDAETEADLYYALVKLSNARRDHHLTVTAADVGARIYLPRAETNPPLGRFACGEHRKYPKARFRNGS